MAHRYYFTEVAQKGNEIRFVLFEHAKIDPVKIPDFVAGYQGKLKFYADKKIPQFIYQMNRNSRQKDNVMEVIADVLSQAEQIQEM